MKFLTDIWKTIVESVYPNTDKLHVETEELKQAVKENVAVKVEPVVAEAVVEAPKVKKPRVAKPKAEAVEEAKEKKPAAKKAKKPNLKLEK